MNDMLAFKDDRPIHVPMLLLLCRWEVSSAVIIIGGRIRASGREEF